MKFEREMKNLVPILIIVLTINVAQGGGVSLSNPGCPQKCGNVTIPYPFGIGWNCSHNSSFTITCGQNYKPYLSSAGNLEVVEVCLEKKRVTVMQPITPLNCSSDRLETSSLHEKSLVGTPFSFDSPLAVVGCRTEVLLTNSLSFRGCKPICGPTTVGCYGINCCRISTADAGPLQHLQISYRTYDHPGFGVCGYAFLADREWFTNDRYDIKYSFRNSSYPLDTSLQHVPVNLDWDFVPSHTEGVTCRNETRSYSVASYYNVTRAVKNRCYCDNGFEGNPYLPGGCRDINECDDVEASRNCTACVNTVGSYTCHGDDESKKKVIIIGTICALFLLVGAWTSFKCLRKRFEAYQKNEFLKDLLIHKLSSSNDGGGERIKQFGSKELAQATDHYNENRILGRGGQGIVYKGMLSDGRIVAVKKSEKVDGANIDAFINEVVLLSQINHRNVVKLQGYCLNTKVLLLVYEFIPNGTLFQHIHDQNDGYFSLSWKMRVRIATDVAEALSYLHNAACVPIYHRDVKSTNILLDDKYRAKVSDFGTSRSHPIDQTHMTTRVLGTFV